MNTHQNRFDVWDAIRKPVSTILLVGLSGRGDKDVAQAQRLLEQAA